jgi:hypothetical protein
MYLKALKKGMERYKLCICNMQTSQCRREKQLKTFVIPIHSEVRCIREYDQSIQNIKNIEYNHCPEAEDKVVLWPK